MERRNSKNAVLNIIINLGKNKDKILQKNTNIAITKNIYDTHTLYIHVYTLIQKSTEIFF